MAPESVSQRSARWKAAGLPGDERELVDAVPHVRPHLGVVVDGGGPRHQGANRGSRGMAPERSPCAREL